MPMVKVNDINMYYEIHGNANSFPLILIMGWGGTTEWWDSAMIEELAKQYKVVIFDNRGIGKTDKPELKYTVKMFADDTVGLMNKLDIQKTHLLGISMGGMIAQEIAINYPNRIEKLILCSTHSGMSFVSKILTKILLFFGKRRMKDPEKGTELLISLLFTEDFINNSRDKIDEIRAEFTDSPTSQEDFARQFHAVEKFKTRKRLKNLDKPTLIMHGKKDALISYKESLKLVDLIPYAKLALFDNSAHALFTEETERVLCTLINFLA